MFCKKFVLKKFAKLTGKHLCQSLFLIKLQAWGLQLDFLKKPCNRCFLVNFVKYYTQSQKSVWVNIFSELLLTDKLRHYLQINAKSCIDFNTLIVYASYITYNYNHTACINYFIIILIFTTHYSTCFSFLQITLWNK